MTHTQRTRRIVIAAIVCAAIGAGIVYGVHKTSAAPVAAGAAPDVPVTAARQGTYVERVDAQGRVGPPAGSSAKLAFAQPGVIASVDVHVGDTVRAGQPLAELDRAALAAAVEGARADARVARATYGNGAAPAASVASAQARYAVAADKLATLEQRGPAALSSRIAAESVARQAALKVAADESQVTREQELATAGVAAQKDVDAARAQLASDEADQRAADARVAAAASDFASALRQARADADAALGDLQAARAQNGVLGGQAESARARLDAANVAYANGVLTARGDGVVLSVLKHPGEAVDPTTPVLEVGPALGHAVTLTVPGDVAQRVAVGNALTLTVHGAQSTTVNAHIVAVVPAVDPVSQVATIVADGAPAAAVPGTAVGASIVVGHLSGIIVPATAIVQDPQTGNAVVFVQQVHPKDGASGFALRRVTVRASDTANAVVASGLRAGERVAVQGGYTLLAPAGG